MNRTLEITTKVGCVNDCIYCPQDVLMNAYEGKEYMSLFTFMKILLNTPKDVQIDFAGFCEPFLNPRASIMMSRAIMQGYSVVLDTTLTGFDYGDMRILDGLRFKEVYIHEFDDSVKQKMEKYAFTTDKLIHVKLQTKDMFSRAGNLWETETKQGRFRCGWKPEFDRNVVLPNGDVYLCCMDYGLKHKIGNLLTTHYNDLDRNKITKLSNQQHSECICRNCEIAKII